MRNQKWPSIVMGVLVAGALVIGPGMALVGVLKIHPTNEQLDIAEWRRQYEAALGWSAGGVALLTAIWLWVAHTGDGMDTKAGYWYLLWLLAVMSGALLAAFLPESLKEGPGLPMAMSAGLVLAGYWVATLVMTPSHYRFTPFLAKVFLGAK